MNSVSRDHEPRAGSALESRDALGDRMKRYEAAEDRRLERDQFIYARIDGRSFSHFTNGMERPFDADMSGAMIDAAAGLVERTHARIGYVQSDEISLVWLPPAENGQAFFDGRIQKLASLHAGLSTALFTASVASRPRIAHRLKLTPHFDCRVMGLPSPDEAANMLLWRELDATKNAISMAARAHFSAKRLYGKRGAEMVAMLAEVGVVFGDYPEFFRRGTYLRRRTEQRPLTEAELARIPEAHRPPLGQLVARTAVKPLALPPLLEIADRPAALFGEDADSSTIPADERGPGTP